MTRARSSASAPLGRGESGFTLVELVVALSVFALISLGLFGVLVLGARSAGSGERITEQARRYRVANEVLSRQIAASEPIQLPPQGDGEGLDEDSEGTSVEPFFFGDMETLEFVTTAPQRPDASGMAIVRYWLEDGTLRMSERPVFSAYGTDKLDRVEGEDTMATILLYDVASVTFSYQRESDSDEWLDHWDATEEEQLPACVRIDVRPSAAGGPDFYHEIPVMVGTFNQIADVDTDFFGRRVGQGSSEDDEPGAGGSGGGGGGKGGKGAKGGGGGGENESPAATVPGDEDVDDGE